MSCVVYGVLRRVGACRLGRAAPLCRVEGRGLSSFCLGANHFDIKGGGGDDEGSVGIGGGDPRTARLCSFQYR